MSTLITALSVDRADGQRESLIIPGYRSVQRLELPTRARSVVSARTDRGGATIRTRHRSEAAVSISGVVHGGSAARAWLEMDAVSAALQSSVAAPRALRWTRGDGQNVFIQARLEELVPPLEVGPDMIRYQAIFRSESPHAFTEAVFERRSFPMGLVGGGLKIPPFTFPWKFEEGEAGTVAVRNDGTVPVRPFLTLHGRLVNPRVRHMRTNEEIFLNYTILAGQSMLVDMHGGRAYLNGTAERPAAIDRQRSVWWEIEPRIPTTLRLFAESADFDAHMVVSFQHPIA